MRAALARLSSEFGANDRRAIESAAELVHCLLGQGKREEAGRLLENAEHALTNTQGDISRQRASLLRARTEFDQG
ncbi:MAG: hypothetical protein IPP82_00040 [Xanthomonadales bacterium]|nr:hypothetical protein [Xanthomonadales bacterium]